MARKAYSKEEREKIRDMLVVTALELFSRQGIQHTALAQIYEKAGISKTFFYSFFPTKEDLVVEALYYQQPRILAFAREGMACPDLCWRDKIIKLMYVFCRSKGSWAAIMSIGEQKAIRERLSNDNFRIFRKKQEKFFNELMVIMGLPDGAFDPKLWANLLGSMFLVYEGIPETLPFLFPEAADNMMEFQINAIADSLEKVRNSLSS